jgi:hypothetical protein
MGKRRGHKKLTVKGAHLGMKHGGKKHKGRKHHGGKKK